MDDITPWDDLTKEERAKLTPKQKELARLRQLEVKQSRTIAKLDEEMQAARARIRKQEKKEQEQANKRDDRRKMILGDWVLSYTRSIEGTPEGRRWLRFLAEKLDSVVKDRDRKLMAEFLPARSDADDGTSSQPEQTGRDDDAEPELFDDV